MEPRYALLLGVARHSKRPELDHPPVANDVTRLRTVLGACGFEVIANEPTDPHSADRAALRELLFEGCEQSPVGSTLLLYFGGHGVNLDGCDYLVPSDVPPNSRRLATYLLPVDELQEAIRDSPAARVVLLLDACREGFELGSGDGSRSTAFQPLSQARLRDLGEKQVVQVFACQKGRKSYSTSIEETGHGLFSQALAEVLESSAPVLTLRQALEGAKPRVEEAARRLGKPQQVIHYLPGELPVGGPDPLDTIFLKGDAALAAKPPESPKPAPGRSLLAPPRPPLHHQPRSEALAAVKQLLLGAAERVGITGRAEDGLEAESVGVRGMGGLGKTVLAADVAGDPEIAAAFPDGVFWVELGENPVLGRLQAELVQSLGDTPAAEDRLDRQITALLEARRCLVVLDDAWQAHHVAAFGRAGARSRFLITSRDGGLLDRAGASVHDLELLSPGAARQLLAAWSGLPPDRLPGEAGEIVRRCGYLPLAVSVIGARLKGHRDAWPDVLAALAAGSVDETDAEMPGYRYGSLNRALRVSLEALDPADREACLNLAIFPEDTLLPESVMLRLGGARGDADWKATERLRRLQDLSLVRGEGMKAFRLHDRVRDFLRDAAGREPGGLRDRHLRLIHSYRQAAPAHGTADAVYYYERLPWHLAEAGETGALRELLFDFDWLEAKLAGTDVDALIGDYALLAEPAGATAAAALRLAAHVLRNDPAQLGPQLIGRLDPGDDPDLRRLVAAGRGPRGDLWLRPRAGLLTTPGRGLLATLLGHSGAVNAVAVTPDGKHVVSGSSDKTVRVWELASGREVRHLEGHSGSVNAVVVTPDGKYAVSGSDDNTLRVWELASGREVQRLEGHSDSVSAVAVTPDGKHIISGSWDHTLRVWDLDGGREVRRLEGHDYGVTAAAVTPDGKHAVSASVDKTFRMWDLASGREVQRLEGDSLGVYAVAVTPDGRYAISGSDDRTIRVWDLASGREVRRLEGNSSVVITLAVTSDGKHIVSGSWDNTLRVWELASGREVRHLEGHSGSVIAVVVTPDGKYAVSGSDDETLRVWELASGREVQRPEGHSYRVNAVAVTPDGKHAVSGSSDNTLRVWGLASGREIQRLEGHSLELHAVVVTPDGKHAVSGSYDRTLRVWELVSGREVQRLDGHSDWVNAVAVTPDGRYAVSGSADETLRVWELASGREVQRLEGHSNSVNAVVVTPDGKHAVSGSYDRTLRVWELASGREVQRPEGHSEPVYAVAITPDGKHAVSGSRDETLRVWELASGREVQRLEGHSEPVYAVALTPDGRYAISGSWDKTLRVWDLTRGSCLVRLDLDSGVLAVGVSPDGQSLVVGLANGRVGFLTLEEAETAPAP